MYPVVANQLASFKGSGTGQAEELNNVTVTGFGVQIAPPSGVSSIPWEEGCSGDFDWQVATKPLPPAATMGAPVEAIRSCNAGVLRRLFQTKEAGFDPNLSAEVYLHVTLRAKGRHGTSDVESAPFTFPIRVCYGCLQTGYLQPGYAQYNFPNIAACEVLTSNPYPGNPCNTAQDAQILCCSDKKAGIVCPGVPDPTATGTATSTSTTTSP
jgi:hypothetical protein